MSIETLQDLIRIPSLSGQEKPVQDYIKSYFEGFNLKPFFQDNNLILNLHGNDQTKAFIFNSHVDVVSPGDELRWIHGGPWSGAIENGRIYGRGTSDMKGGVFATIELAKRMSKRDLACDLWFTYVVQEETDGSGTKSFAEWFQNQGYLNKYQKLAAVFAEPTSLNELEYGHRGNYFIKAWIDGDAGHAARPHKIKTHAIMEVLGFITDLQRQMEQWKEQFSDSEFLPPTITPTAIEAKTGSPNKVSDHCEATFDLRTIPQFDEKAYEVVAKLAQSRGINLSFIYSPAPTGYTAPDAKIIKAFLKLKPDLKLTVNQGATDLGFLTRLGIEGVIFGPGDMDQAHTLNESIAIEQVLNAPNIYEKVFEKWVKD